MSRESTSPENGSLDRNKIRYMARCAALLILLAWALMNLPAVLSFLRKVLSLFSPFLLGGVIAFLINVMLRPLERFWDRTCRRMPEKLKRPICLLVSTLLMVGILFAVIFMLLPSLRESGNEFARSAPVYAEEVKGWWTELVRFAERYNVILPEYAINTDRLTEKVMSFVNAEGSGIIIRTWGAATSIFSGVFNLLLAFVFAMYLLAQKEAAAGYMKQLIVRVLPKEKAGRLLRMTALIYQTFSNFVSGQVTEAAIIGVLCFAGMLVLGIPYAGAVSVFVAVTALIPMFGAWIGGGFGFVLILLANPMKALWFVIFLLILQQVEGNLIYPKVVGKSVGLPGILVLVAVTIGSEAFGIPGMLFSVPVCAVLYSLYLEFMQQR